MYNKDMEETCKNNAPSMLETVMGAANESRTAHDPSQLGPLVLAYIGDTVFDLYVRTKLVTSTTLTAHGLHMAAAKKVCAQAQAEAYRRVESLLTEEESAVFRRGRNGHMGTIPKNASIGDYRLATGVEAVIGWLYLKGRDGRINELMRIILDDETNGQ